MSVLFRPLEFTTLYTTFLLWIPQYFALRCYASRMRSHDLGRTGRNYTSEVNITSCSTALNLITTVLRFVRL